MTNNTKQIIERMQASFPNTYNVYNKKTILYALLTVFGNKYGMRTDTIDRLYAMIGIDSTYDEDLEHRWGSLLGIYKQSGESSNDYRNRLKIIYSSLSGGTAEAIKYAIASAAGIESDVDTINKYVKVYDAWEYPYNIDPTLLGIDEIIDETSLYGSIICTVDLAGVDNNIIEHTKIIDAINHTKASGINHYLLLLYNAEDVASFERDGETIYNNIKYIVTDDAEIYGADDYLTYNITLDAIYDMLTFRGKSDAWSNFGTNSAILNKSFVTNIYEEPDEYIDVIHYHNDSSAVLNVGILGQIIMGNIAEEV
jgi:hypothetical protein